MKQNVTRRDFLGRSASIAGGGMMAPMAVPLDKVNDKVAGLDYAETSCRLAAQYINSVIADAKKRALAA